jgi:hypothetical protein
MKEDLEIKAKKRKRKRPESYWQQKHRSFVNKYLDGGGGYKDIVHYISKLLDTAHLCMMNLEMCCYTSQNQ